MSSTSFFPTTEAGQSVWFANYPATLTPAQGSVYGIIPEEVTNTFGEISFFCGFAHG